MTGSSFATAAVLLMVSPTAIAQVNPPSDWRATSRFVAAVSVGAAHGDSSTSTPQGDGRHGIPFNFGVSVGAEHRIFDRLWLAVAYSAAEWIEGAGVEAGYLYWRLDAGVAPRLELYRGPGRGMTTSFDLALPIGLSQPFGAAPQRRAFSEQIDNQLGWYGGATVSVTVLFRLGRQPSAPRFGFRAETGYVRHASHRRTTFTPTDATQPPVVQESDIVENDVPIFIAAVFGI